jgi:preprotein translocase subunit SecG
MKAFIAGVVAVVAIAVVAFVVLDTQQRDTGQSFASQNTRLPGAN